MSFHYYSIIASFCGVGALGVPFGHCWKLQNKIDAFIWCGRSQITFTTVLTSYEEHHSSD